MDNELLVLIRLLLKKSFLTTKEIEVETGASRRQITYRMEKLNHMLKEHAANTIRISTRGDIMMDQEIKHTLRLLLKQAKDDKYYVMNKKERMIYLYLMLFLNLSDVSQSDLVNALKVSRSTALLDFKELQQELSTYHIKVANNRTRGYYLVGSELSIRRYMMELVIYFLAEEHNTKVFDIFIDDFHLDLFEYSRLVISELADKYDIRFVEDRLTEFIYIFCFLKVRMSSDIPQDEQILRLQEVIDLSTMKEYQFTKELLSHFKQTQLISPIDQYYISSWILGICVGNVEEDTQDCLVIAEIVEKIMFRFESLSGIHYKDSEDIFRKLYSHFRPAYYRLLFKIPIVNPLRERVKEEFPELFQLVKETMKPFNALFGEHIPDDEIAYLTIHFTAIYSKSRAMEVIPRKTALIVCLNGIGSSAILYSELSDLFPEMQFLPPMETSKLLHADIKADIIFTTSELIDIDIPDVPIVKVSPVMNFMERYQVAREVYLLMGNAMSKQPDIDAIMDIIAHHADIKNGPLLQQELLRYFSNVDVKEDVQHSSLALTNMITESIIQLQVEANDWEDAIRKAGKPMIEHLYVKPAYIEEIIRIMHQEGPFVVITKHVALPHTKPSSGALRCGLGLTVLKEGITFGSQEHDPIKYIFTLSAVDNESHLTAMSQLLELFNEPSFFTMMDEAETPQEVIAYIKSHITMNGL
ncbi:MULTISPECIES: BglG family transcription antiterminator [Bacillota]|jgi:transcriptional antiterminator/mannitol/fructose-specific phosphotransferase system IIA component (Ntr-type)|uniref:BglG family transcription antiterminator n=2 Tax=Amedibacillus TaxID=2749846 RepID=A0A7G9GQE5_9FIRM|nr:MULTISPECIES: BglG family transcription antiterminator [Bacillota]QNM13027.1 BglG family transcription antiterminator [[Eubacterium] hominis]MCH4287142.1 BglG family transcription antiterminator [Amedibacillus hominis]RGB49805.1 PRD domain-containing protein [Absiella sp. AM22-9]RGB53232.1 PRD domain-containing protein [Absiella sp. AM10-20]RGB64105.1 PRD domain-containing protein [Absiella sp. AM09-45]